ncbi:MAG: hypothetical protein L0228_20350 [Planctomycetes bacterium]|nr:hypothetical protein [Planctomycetota bacterium]
MSISSMRGWQIILTKLIFLTGCQPWSGQQIAPAAPPMAVPYPMTAAPQPMFVPGGQPYLPPGTVLVPTGPQIAPVFPQPSFLPGPVVVPQPVGTMPGGVAPPQFSVPTVPPGATIAPDAIVPPGATVPPLAEMPSLGPNPIVVPVTNEDLAWDQIADVVSDYFTIAREQRARLDVGTEGRIETAPQDGATWLEPHRHDSVGSFNRWESTFQTIRRRALLRVIPDAAGYLVEVVVEKELEDLPNPEKATAGAAVFRSDDSLPSRRLEDVSRARSSPRWIQLGRDPLLEQRMLADIQARLGGVAAR